MTKWLMMGWWEDDRWVTGEWQWPSPPQSSDSAAPPTSWWTTAVWPASWLEGGATVRMMKMMKLTASREWRPGKPDISLRWWHVHRTHRRLGRWHEVLFLCPQLQVGGGGEVRGGLREHHPLQTSEPYIRLQCDGSPEERRPDFNRDQPEENR